MVEVKKNLGKHREDWDKHMGRAHKDFNIVIKNQNLKKTVNFVYLRGN